MLRNRRPHLEPVECTSAKTIDGVAARFYASSHKTMCQLPPHPPLFTDEYSFSLPEQANVREQIRHFFKNRGARPVNDGATATFSRGNWLCSYVLPHIIPWRERDFLQNITVQTRPAANGMIDVDVRYVVHTFCMLRLQPAGLQNEIRELFQELG